MGLDMYLERVNTHGHTIEEVQLVSDYLDWKNNMKKFKENGEQEKVCSFKEWCGHGKVPSKELVKDIEGEVHEVGKYSKWFTAFEEVGYWRKANAIHNWFVENVQGGNDDCGRYVVSREQLEELLEKCQYILDNVVVVKGKIKNGETYKDGKWRINYEDGETLDEISQSLCARVLPTTSGFFFGGTDYDQYYLDDIKETVEILNNVLKSTDFETGTICYSSSW